VPVVGGSGFDSNGRRTTLLIKEGFFWKDFPAIEQILRSHMEEYYDLSTFCRQSKAQQTFNNRLVLLVRERAAQCGWRFDPEAFDDKKLRDRVRCFFKTLIQNAKKRLLTVLRNPHKKRNREALGGSLLKHVEEARREMEERRKANNNAKSHGSSAPHTSSAGAGDIGTVVGPLLPAPSAHHSSASSHHAATVTSSDDSDSDSSDEH